MKKVIALILVAAMTFTLFACENTERGQLKIPNPAGDGKILDDEKRGDDYGSDEGNGLPKPRKDVNYTISNELLLDNEFVNVTVTKAYVEEKYGDFVLKLHFENRTDETLLFLISPKDSSYNGIMVDNMWTWCDGRNSESLGQGQKAYAELFFRISLLPEAYVGVAEEITFDLSVRPTSWLQGDPPYAEEHFTLYPTGLDANSVSYPKRVPAKGETTLVDNNDFTFIIEKMFLYNETGSSITLQTYFENKTDKMIGVHLFLESVNGFLVNNEDHRTIFSGKRYVNLFWILLDDEYGISEFEDVEEIEFSLHVSYDDGSGSIVDDTFTYHPQN